MGSIGILYRKIRGVIVNRPANFSWVMDGLAASAAPVSGRQIGWLRLHGVQFVLSLTEKPLPMKWFEAGTLRYGHLPLENHSPLTISQLEEAVGVLEKALSNGGKVLVHCAAGLGRTGTVLAAYLVKAHGDGPAQAIERIRSTRPGSIENFQEKVIYDYCEKINASS